ncbi:mitochondrial ribosomal small subunit component, partial [Tulasnella sp. 403]
MPRRFASQVHITMSRMIKNGFVRDVPLWFDAVMKYPPLPTPPRQSPRTRTLFDTAPETSTANVRRLKQAADFGRWKRPDADEIVYLEDRVRRQFFKDHPFEAFRSRTLVENGLEVAPLHPIQGPQWTHLKQHGPNPTAEDVVQFTMCLHEHHEKPLSLAYRTAVLQFRGLRSEYEMASAFSAQEAESYGAEFGPGELDKGFMRERQSIASFLPRVRAAARISAKMQWAPVWKMPGVAPPEETWTRGREYAKRLEEGKLPTYSPELEAPPEEVERLPVEDPAIVAQALEKEEQRMQKTDLFDLR